MLYPQFKGVPFIAYDVLVKKLKKQAKEEMGLPESEIVVRSLRPEDIGFTNPIFASTTSADTWTNSVNTYTIADNRYVGIHGVVFDADENTVVALRITREGKTARIWAIQQVSGFEDKAGYADDPITIEQNTQITIEEYGLATTKTNEICLLGVVVERRGLLINP